MFVNVLTVQSAVKMVNVQMATNVALLTVVVVILKQLSVSVGVLAVSVLIVHAMKTNVAQVRVVFLKVLKRLSKINEIIFKFSS